MITVALPLSAGRIMMSSLFFNSFNARDSAGERLGVSFGDLLNIPTILDRACDVVCGSALDDFKAVSILATILGVGI